MSIGLGRHTGVLRVVTDIVKRSPTLPQVSFLRPMATEGYALLAFYERRGRHVDDHDDHLVFHLEPEPGADAASIVEAVSGRFTTRRTSLDTITLRHTAWFIPASLLTRETYDPLPWVAVGFEAPQ